ncbi:MAG: hypothetical protein J0L70_20385 [Leptolyngbya sp. UWPOB_LEPTO1]|uniref:hypothetical protein n=1 Tax=Leptolyngbya sp. UWPOB_LEPTO1 TaxID=2815653 RepID=UPI001ACA320C|nr:hypothetical protein [Leptolyngbya sp. UWPOB_LEPTO1]MBN8562899.1 hypothetical protein [Leptolyngbya sp. UWPOB_LEPTO1]
MGKEEKLLKYWRELSSVDQDRVLEFTQSLQENHRPTETKQMNSRERVWQAYLESEQENQKVYQRLANS